MNGKQSTSIDMTTGAILPKLLAMSLPLMASSVLQLLFNAADVVVVGNFASEHSLAAVGSTTALISLTINVFMGLSIGSNAVVSYFLGAKDDSNVSKAVHTSILLSLVSGAILTVVGLVFVEDFLRLMQTPIEAFALSAIYLRIYFCGMIAMMIFNFGSALLRAKGDTKRPLYYLAIAGVVNVGLNLLFVIVFHMDVEGVGYATIISQFISAALVLRCLRQETDAFRLELRKLCWDKAIVSRIFAVGIPAGFQGVVFSLSNVVIQSSINGFGPIVMAGSAAASSLEGFVWISMNAFSQCVLTFTSQNVGAKTYSRLNRIAFTACACSALTGLIFGNLTYYYGEFLLGIYDARPEVIESGMKRVFMVCCFYSTCGLMDCIVGSIRGMGYAITPTVVSLLGACGLRIVWIGTIFQIPQYHTESMLFLSYPISWVVTFLMHCVCYYYMRRRLPKNDGESARFDSRKVDEPIRVRRLKANVCH